MLCDNVESLLDKLGVSFQRSRKMYSGPCPIHGGDKISALNLYITGDTVPGYWRCNTRHCEWKFPKNIIGFVQGVLSHRKFGWIPETNGKRLGFHDTIDWCCNFLGKKLQDIEIDQQALEKSQFTANIRTLTRSFEDKRKGTALCRSDVRKYLKIPSTYYISRGYSPSVLDRYDVGFYPHKDKPLSNRVAVPVYDEDYSYVIGFTGRSVFGSCGKCGQWHDPQGECEEVSKWFNHGLSRESCLYNYWFSRDVIRESRVAVLVEGPGEIWRLEEAGFHNGIAMLGSDLSEQQQVILETSGAMGVVIVTNNDAAGKMAAENISARLARSFRLDIVLPEDVNDLGEMKPKDIPSSRIGNAIFSMIKRCQL